MSIGFLATSLWNGIGPTISQGWERTGASWEGAQKTVGDVNNAIQGAAKTTGEIFGSLSNGVNTLRKYWYVPVIIGGVIVGYRLIKSTKPLALAAQK